MSQRLVELKGHLSALEVKGRERTEEVQVLKERLRAEQADYSREREAHTQVCHYSV